MGDITSEELLPAIVKVPSLPLPGDPTPDQLNFWEYQRTIWLATGRYLDYLQKLELGLNPRNPFPNPDCFPEPEAILIEYLRLTATFYWQQFQVIKVGWELIKPDRQHRINIFDTPRTVFYKCLQDGANRPLKNAVSPNLGAGKTFGDIYKKLTSNYKLYSGKLEGSKYPEDRELAARILEELVNSDTWDWCLHCIWEKRFDTKTNPSNFPGTSLGKAFSDFLKLHRQLNGFFRKNGKHFTAFKWYRGYLVNPNGQKINFSAYLLNKT